MIKMIAAICRRPGMTHSEYLAYVQHVHGRVSTEVPVSLRRYVQNHVFDSAFGSSADPTHVQVVSRDSVTELYWDDPQGMAATFQHEHVRTKVGPDGLNFSDMRVQLSLVAREVERAVPHPGNATGAKVMHFLRAADGLGLEQFFERWSQAHERIMSTDFAAARSLKRCVHSQQLPDFNSMLSYFGGLETRYEGVASLWFDNVSSVGAFRDYERALLAINADAATAFYQPSHSFFLYATEVPILDTLARRQK